MRISLGSERLLASAALDGKRVGVVCNPASIDHSSATSPTAWPAAPARTLAAIFGPQHGFRSDVQENMIESGHAEDDAAPRAGLLALQRDAHADAGDDERASTCW